MVVAVVIRIRRRAVSIGDLGCERVMGVGCRLTTCKEGQKSGSYTEEPRTSAWLLMMVKGLWNKTTVGGYGDS
jgi:hypothetical protein